MIVIMISNKAANTFCKALHILHDDVMTLKLFSITGLLCGESAGLRWNRLTKRPMMRMRSFDVSFVEEACTCKQSNEMPVIWYTMTLMWRHCNVILVTYTCVNKLDHPLRWRHNGRDSVSNHQSYHCLLNRLFRRRSKKTPKLGVTGLCVGNSPGTGEFPAQMASNAENVSIWWRHHERIHASINWTIIGWKPTQVVT